MSYVPLEIDREAGTFRASFPVEAGPLAKKGSSAVVNRAWITFGVGWTDARFHFLLLDDAGNHTLDTGDVTLKAWRRGVREIPAGSTLAVVEGTLTAPAQSATPGAPSVRVVSEAQ